MRYYLRDQSGVVFAGSWLECAECIRQSGWDVYGALETGAYTILPY